MNSEHNAHALLVLLQQQLAAARAKDHAVQTANTSAQALYIPGTGKSISNAYEQLRNAAEYTEEHLLLQRAIRRFYKRSFTFSGKKQLQNIGEELVVELTHAGYLADGAYSQATAQRIQELTESHVTLYKDLREQHVPRDTASDWTLSLLSVEIEGILNPHHHMEAIATTAYQHYLHIFPRDMLAPTAQEQELYEICLYIAVHEALLKSDLAVVRHDLLRMYQHTSADMDSFIQFNKKITELYTARLTIRIKRIVGKHGAPMRILKRLADERPDLLELLSSREMFLDAYDRQVDHEYRQTQSRLTKGIIKSIIFIFITKIIVGLGIEIPYDLIFIGSIAVVPLLINLLFPPLYMASLKFGLKMPTRENARALHEYIDNSLFTGQPVAFVMRDPIKTVSTLTKILYAVLFLVPVGIITYVLSLLHFTAVQAIIFFVFLSTASFLGFRLSSMIRELEITSHQTRTLSAIRDFFYLPFILIGQWISSKYAKVNAIAYILDIAIELPLKTFLRLTRQWTRFLKEKHDEIY